MTISLSLAQALKENGLQWTPTKNDFFAIPDRGMDEAVFVINDMTVLVEMIRGRLSVTFHGTAEWALDHIVIAELVWLPTEGQLRERLEQYLIGQPQPALKLTSTVDGYRCEIRFRDECLVFEGFGVSEVYGQALLHMLRQGRSNHGVENL